MSARLLHVAWSCTLVLMLTLAAPLPTSAATCPTPTAPYGFAPECLTQAWRAPATVSNTLAFAEVAQPTADCPTPTTPYAISAACIQLLTRPSVTLGRSVFQVTLGEPNQKTTEVSTDELKQVLRDGSALVFDSRPHMEYAVSHIPGARNVAPKPGVAMSQYVSDVAEIGRVAPDTGTSIVLYCNGPFCGKSKRLGEELVEAGHTNVRRYQLGAPTWRALVGLMQIELDGVRYVREGDRTAVFVDARFADDFAAGTLSGSRNIPLAEVAAAKDDGRLPMEDHNTRVVVFGSDTEQARAVAVELAKNAFHNVAFFDGTLHELLVGLGESAIAVGH